MVKLYASVDDRQHWIGYTPETGYVIFPAEINGWGKRKPLRGFDPLRIREVPARLGFNTGFPFEEKKKSAAA